VNADRRSSLLVAASFGLVVIVVILEDTVSLPVPRWLSVTLSIIFLIMMLLIGPLARPFRSLISWWTGNAIRKDKPDDLNGSGFFG
jgi:Flp pilus assembly protein protease CpaA